MIVWGISSDDIQSVAWDLLKRRLTENEMERFERFFNLDWWDRAEDAIEKAIKTDEELESEAKRIIRLTAKELCKPNALFNDLHWTEDAEHITDIKSTLPKINWRRINETI